MTEQAESIVRIIKEMVRPDANAIEQQLMLLQKPLLNAQQDLPADFSPIVALLQSIKDIRHQVEVANFEAKRNLASLESFIGRATRLGGKSDETLQVVLDTRATNRRNQEIRLLANELEASRRENAAMTTRATIEKERQIAEAAKAADGRVAKERAARVKLEAKIEADRIAADAEAKRIAAAKAKLEQEFQRDLPSIRRYLGPLLGDGYELRGNGSSKPGPASFSQLVTLGTQAETKDGLIAMIKVLDAGWNDRTETKWISANYRYKEPKQWSSLDMAPLQNAHDLFRKYGPLLVEKGMLAP